MPRTLGKWLIIIFLEGVESAIIWRINLNERMLVWFRCCLDFNHFPHFKKNYPFYPLFILRFILFSCLFWEIRLKLRQGLTLSKDRKRIKNSELVEYIVDLVFVGQVCPTDKPPTSCVSVLWLLLACEKYCDSWLNLLIFHCRRVPK